MATTLTLKPQATPNTLPPAEKSTTDAPPPAEKSTTDAPPPAEKSTTDAPPPADTPSEPAPAPDFAALLGKRRWVKTVHGDMLNLFTNVWLTSDPKKVEVDQFVVNQLEAGKMALHTETDE
jgi:hypothetical protein